MSKADLNDWTIMVYMAGDNNLSADMVSSLEQLRKIVGPNDNVRLFVYYDGFGTDVPTLYCDFSFDQNSQHGSPRAVFHQANRIKNKFIARHNHYNENSASVNNILNFVHWCVVRGTPADIANRKHAFIFSGHTFGFVNKGLFRDEKSDYSMSYGRLRYMFERITSEADQLESKAAIAESEYLKETGNQWSNEYRKERMLPILSKRLDLLGFDSCVMSTIEVAHEFSRFSKTMVASEGSIPTAGWNYAQIIGHNISRSGSTEPKTLATSFVEEFIKEQNRFALADISVDISAWDLEKTSSVYDPIERLAGSMLSSFASNQSVAYRQLRRALVYVHWQCQTYMLEQHVDLGDLCGLLHNELNLIKGEISETEFGPLAEIQTACQDVIAALRDVVMLTGFSGGDFQYSTGVSLFFPWSWTSYLSARKDYESLLFVKETAAGKKWNEFLVHFLTKVTFRPPVELTTGNGPQTTVVYESFNLSDETTTEESTRRPNATGTNEPNGEKEGKQWPNSSKQWPNSSKQWPNSARGTDQLSVFLARFMKLKNNGSHWNRAGFSSTTIKLSTDFSTTSDSDSTGTAENDPSIKIPAPDVIKMMPDPVGEDS